MSLLFLLIAFVLLGGFLLSHDDVDAKIIVLTRIRADIPEVGDIAPERYLVESRSSSLHSFVIQTLTDKRCIDKSVFNSIAMRPVARIVGNPDLVVWWNLIFEHSKGGTEPFIEMHGKICANKLQFAEILDEIILSLLSEKVAYFEPMISL